MNAFDENHIRLGLVFRNELPIVVLYRDKLRVIRSILVPQERLAEGAFAKHIIPMFFRDIVPAGYP